jgi:AAA+ ATPase superfamily predicted ATPase
LREPSTYNAIIEAIAQGASKLNEISTKSHLENNKCAKYLGSLLALGLVSKEHPCGEPAGRKSIYKLEDQLFRFWYRFVYSNISAITAGLGAEVWEHVVNPQLNAYMGLVFEVICKQWLYEQAKQKALPFFIGDIGRWWGTNATTRGQEEIDMMAAQGDEVLFGECKWHEHAANLGVLNDLLRKSQMFRYKKTYLFIFARDRFTGELHAAAKKYKNVRLCSFMEMVKAFEKRGDIED